MHKPSRQCLSYLLISCMILALIPTGSAGAQPGATVLDLSVGSVALYEDGYKQPAGAAAITPYVGDYALTGSSAANTVTVVTGTHKIYLDGVGVDVNAVNGLAAFEIQGTSSVTLILEDGKANTFRSGEDRAGIQVADGASLTITTDGQVAGDGALVALGKYGSAGIGGCSAGTSGGTIVIDGGTITATGGYDGAGIGSGRSGDNCNITINGGTITATGTADAAGIGAGNYGSNGSVRISGGTVTALSTVSGAGIGTGYGGEHVTVAISGGTVTATGKNNCPGIGAYYFDGCTIDISGGVVTATGGPSAAAIGSGDGNGGGVINISGGTVTANGTYRGAGIGGYSYDGTTINISGGTVVSNGGQYAAGIGLGYAWSSATSTVLNLDGGTLTVQKGADAADPISGTDAPYDMNLILKTTVGTAASRGGTIKLGAGQAQISMNGAAVGAFYLDKGGNAIAPDDTVVTAIETCPGGKFLLSPSEPQRVLLRQADNLSWKYIADATDPAVPPGGTITTGNIATRSVDLAWSAASDNASAAADIQYKVFYSATDNISSVGDAEANGSVAQDWTDALTSKRVSGLVPNTDYFFNALARDEAGNKSAYTAATAKTTPFVLTAGAVSRTSDAIGSVKFASDAAGAYYFSVVDDAAAEPVIDTSGAGAAAIAGENTISLTTLTAGAKDLYVKVKDGAGNVSASLKIDIPAYVPPDTTAPTLTAGVASRTSDATGSVKFTSDEAGTYYHAVVEAAAAEPALDTSGAGTAAIAGENTIDLAALTTGAKDVYVKVKDAAGNVSASLKISLPRYASGSSGSGRSASVPAHPPVLTSTSGQGRVSSVNTEISAASGGTGATVTMSSAHAAELARQAEAAGTEERHVSITVLAPAGATAIEFAIPADAVRRMVSAGVNRFVASMPSVEITFDRAALESLSEASGGTGTISVSAAALAGQAILSRYPQAAGDSISATLGDRVIYDLEVNANGGTVLGLGNGRATVSLPYTPALGEDTDSVVVYRIDKTGDLEIIPNSRYEDGKAIFTGAKLDDCAVGYSKVAFGDVPASAWFHKAVNYMAARHVLRGVGDSMFAPDNNVSRADFLIMVMRAYGIRPDATVTANFADAGDTYYSAYLGKAKSLGIVSGIGDNKFAPQAHVSREQMFVILYNALRILDSLPGAEGGDTLGDFSDSSLVSPYAVDAMKAFIGAGVVRGSSGGLAPKDLSTRAQTAQVLYNLISQ